MAKEQVHGVFEEIASQYDAANDRISFGMHRFWKAELEKVAISTCHHVDGSAGLVLDVCCGTGDITEHIARDNPGIFVTGIDFSDSMLEVCRERTADLENVALVEGNALDLPFDDDTFDSAVISFGLRNTPDYKKVLSEMARVVRPGGVVCCLDASVPENPAILPFYQFYYKYLMTLLGGGITHHSEYEWLYDSTQQFLSKEELRDLFYEVGLKYVTVRSYLFGAAALHVGYVTKLTGAEPRA
ncbi:MAG: ubiquinone/menaquinone biosynthesis methyltransferase [Coriobacteriales bacterium]|jgi:demethylmenaquinone methyltransferase/2-methoxy-6-polyprenyl-1,4-benzoquinol methylase